MAALPSKDYNTITTLGQGQEIGEILLRVKITPPQEKEYNRQ